MELIQAFISWYSLGILCKHVLYINHFLVKKKYTKQTIQMKKRTKPISWALHETIRSGFFIYIVHGCNYNKVRYMTVQKDRFLKKEKKGCLYYQNISISCMACGVYYFYITCIDFVMWVQSISMEIKPLLATWILIF